MGSGPFGVPALDALAADPGIELVGVVSAPPRPAGRGGTVRPSAIHRRAQQLGIDPVLAPTRLRDRASTEAVLGLRPELIVLADYGSIVPVALLGLRFGALNLHPSLLPRHRGATPIPATILAGDPEAGVTIIRMDEGIDTGPIVAATRWQLDGTESAPRLQERAAAEAAQLLGRTLAPWIEGRIEPRSQDDEVATLTRMLRREDGRLDPVLPADRLERQVRAYQPWPGSFLDTSVGRLIVWSARAEPSGGDDTPGRLVSDDAAGLALTTSTGRLALVEVQPAGGRRMTGRELVRGRPALLDTRH